MADAFSPSALISASGPPEDPSGLVCLLCRRRFPSNDKYVAHKEKSNLHQDSLKRWQASVLEMQMSIAQQRESMQYTDRAAERRRRDLVSDSQVAAINQKAYQHAEVLREHVLPFVVPLVASAPYVPTPTPEPEEPKPLGENNIGFKMLKSMQWNEGEGLGKSGTGRKEAIQVTQRSARAGLGLPQLPADKGFNNPLYRVDSSDSFVQATKKRLLARAEEEEVLKKRSHSKS